MAYRIFTDSSATLPDEIMKVYEDKFEIIPIVYTYDGKDYPSYEKGKNNDLKSFYDILRTKKKITTSCINENTFINYFEPALKLGFDVIYLGFSSGLSRTYDCSVDAVKTLQAKYPERKILTLDTLCECMGLGLCVYRALKMQDEGASIDEIYKTVYEERLKINHIFTVADLGYLYRGGRLSASKYYIASIIKIKPVLRMDEQGKLVVYSNVFGRKKSLIALVDKMEQKIVDSENQTIFIAHADCLEDALFVKDLILKRMKVKEILLNYIDPVIGSHSGPGTMSVYFYGDDRKVK